MFGIILIILLALCYGYFATQNTQLVTLQFANYTVNPLPIYIVMGISLLIGLLFSWLVSLIDSFFISRKLRGKEGVIKESKQTIHELTKEINRLKIENAKLQGKLEKDALHEDTL